MHPLTRPGVTEDNLNVFIGNNAEKIIRRGSKDISWCWPGFFFSFFWLAYRKAYTVAFIVMFIEFSLMISGSIQIIRSIHPMFVIHIILIKLLVGLFGLRYYLYLASKKVAQINEQVADSALRQTFYKSKGQTSVANVFGYLLIWVIANSLVSFTIGVHKPLQDMSIQSYTTQSDTKQTTVVSVQNGNTVIHSTIEQTNKTAS
jgi:hypothetical protein